MAVQGFRNMIRLFIGILGCFYSFFSYLIMKYNYSDQKTIIVCDRYFYQFFFDLFGRHGEKIVSIFPKPDITFFLDGELSSLSKRMNDIFDSKVDKNYYIDVIKYYRTLAKKYNFVVLDALSDKEDINKKILIYLKVNIYG
ncbi:MAG: dTMP kinase [Candidatus Hodarchaeota archaeon]